MKKVEFRCLVLWVNNKQVLRFLKKNEYKANRMSMSFTNTENSVIDEPRREKTGPRGSLWGWG